MPGFGFKVLAVLGVALLVGAFVLANKAGLGMDPLHSAQFAREAAQRRADCPPEHRDARGNCPPRSYRSHYYFFGTPWGGRRGGK